MRSLRVLAALPFIALCVAACGGTGSNSAQPVTDATIDTPSKYASAPSDVLHAIDGLVATSHGPLPVYDSISASTPSSTLSDKTFFGSPTTVAVVEWQGANGTWLHVSLPTRPNGSTGFVHASDVTLSRFEHRVDVDINSRRLRVGDASGAVVIDTPVAVGSPQNPTPSGSFFVTDVIDTRDGGGAYGPFAIGLSAHSDTLTEFAGGDGAIGIHGTNDPTSIGNPVSHGCIRVPNDVVVQLAQMLAPGTPVTIH
jgi:lipoprotein-anchoring transpeptidase ErfK/SrfK